MQMPAVKTNTLLAAWAIGLASVTAYAQEPAPQPVQAPAPAAAAAAPTAPTAPASGGQPLVTGTDKAPAAIDKSSTAAALDYLYNRKPEDGTAAKQAAEAGERMRDKTIAADALGVKRIDSPAVRARFDKYLALPEVPKGQIDSYNAEMSRVYALLQQRNTFQAWKQLSKLAQFSAIDAGVSQELANRIESIWNGDRASLQIQRSNDQLRDGVRGTSRNADMLSESVRDKEVEYQRRLSQNRESKAQNQKNTPPAQPGSDNKAGAITASPSIDAVIGKLQLTDAYLQTLEAKAKIKLNELKADRLFETAKTNFAEYITNLFESGRDRHVVLAADFYRRLFESSDYPAAMAKQVNAALEMAREVANSIEVVKLKLDDNDIAAASEQLQGAFLTNEFHPALLGLERSHRRKVERFTSALNKMQNLIEAREFTELEELLARMKETAPDFDSTKAKAIVNAVKLEGQLRLGKAKLAAQQGDIKQAMEEFKAAAEVWPNNPDLKDKALTFFDSQDIQSQSLREFDRLVTENNYRGIFEKQLAFAPAMKDDLERQKQLKAALEKVKLAEVALEKANLLRVNGDVFGAWETIELAVAELPSDTKLNTLRGELSGRGAEFVAAINRAKEAEARQELGYSLTWFAVAQRHYPASQVANQAIERLSSKILTAAAL